MAHAGDRSCSPAPLTGLQEAKDPTAQPWGIYSHHSAWSAACPSLMKQTAWEDDQADAWQLSCYIRNPVLNTPLFENARVGVSFHVCE